MRALAAAGVLLVAGALTAISLFGSEGPRSTVAGDRPNVVVVMTDDQRIGTLRHMPNVRRLGGTRYLNHYIAQPICCPARATYLTGLPPRRHGVRTNNIERDLGLPRLHRLERRMLPVWMSRAGYTTGFVGKYMNKYGWGDPYVPRGWDEWSARDGDSFVAVDMEHFDGERSARTGMHDTRVNSRFAVEFIDRHAGGDDPFFLTVMPLAPHSAYLRGHKPDPPVPFPLRSHRGMYAGERAPGHRARRAPVTGKTRFIRRKTGVRHGRANRHWQRHIEALRGVDEIVGRIRTALRRNGEWEDTVVIFTSDNGFMLGEHRLWGKDLPYEQSARVPLVVRGPGFEDRRARKLTTDLDLPATIARLAGAEPMLEQHGRPLWGPTRRWLLLSGEKSRGENAWRALVGRRFAFINWRNGGRELYDLRRDPHQLDPIPGRKAFKRKLNRVLRERWRSA